VCVWGLSYPACTAHVPYYVFICSLSGCTTFSILYRKRLNFRKKICVLISIFCKFYVTFLILGKIWRDVIVCTWTFMYRTHYYCQILIKIKISLRISGKYSNAKFLENPISGSRVISCRVTDRDIEANNHFSQFCEKCLKLKYFNYLKFPVFITHC